MYVLLAIFTFRNWTKFIKVFVFQLYKNFCEFFKLTSYKACRIMGVLSLIPLELTDWFQQSITKS